MRANDSDPAPRSPSPTCAHPQRPLPGRPVKLRSKSRERNIYPEVGKDSDPVTTSFAFGTFRFGLLQAGVSLALPPCLHSSKIRRALLHCRPPSPFPSPPAPTPKQGGLQPIHLPGWRSQLQSWGGGTESGKDHGDRQCALRMSSAWSTPEQFSGRDLSAPPRPGAQALVRCYRALAAP